MFIPLSVQISRPNDVMPAARSKSVKTLVRIKYAILERNGAISVIQKKD